MAIYNAGNAYLQILPSFRGIERMMQRETAKLAREIDKSIAKGANDGLIQAFRGIDTDKVAKAAANTGDEWTSVFEAQVSRQLKQVADALPEFEPKIKLNRFDRAIAQTKRQLTELSSAKIGPTGDVGLDKLGNDLDQIVTRMVRLSDETKHFDQRMRLLATAGQAEMLKGLIDEARDQGLTDGRAFGGAFATAARQRIEQALKSLPEINLDADASPAERAVAALRAQLEALADKRIGVDIDRDRFQQEMSYVTGQLESLSRDPRSVALKFDLDQAARGLREFSEKITPVLDAEMDQAGKDAGERWTGKYVETVQRRLASAIRSIPNIPMTVDNTDAERKLAAIRVSLESLADQQIGVDIDATTAQAQMAALKTRLEDLDSDDVHIDVRTNAAAAAAELDLVSAGTRDADQEMLSLGRDAGITMSRLGYLITIGASIGSIIAPAAATAAVAVAGIGVAAAGAVLGVGVLALGVVGIGDAVSKMDAYQQDADKSARSFAQAQNRVALAARSVDNAERDLAFTREDAAEAQVQAQRRIQDAQLNVAKAQRDAAEAVAQARENEREAIEDVTRARVDARDQIERATEAVADAERSATRAVEDAKEARQELNEALRDAVQDLKELDTAIKRNGNEISKAQTEAMKAKEELDKLLTNPRATEIEKRMAREAYEDRLIQIEELKNQRAELDQQQKEADEKGVESTDRVKRAREELASAEERAADAVEKAEKSREALDRSRADAAERVADAEDRAAKAHQAVTKAQQDGAEKVAAAQVAVADAQKAAAKTQRDSQRQIADGVQALTDAQTRLTQAHTDSGIAGGEAFDNMNDALSKLSPAAQEFAQFIFGLKPELQSLRETAQEGLLPGVQEGIETLVDNYLPSFQAFVGEISKGLGDMFAATAKVLLMPEWRTFFAFLGDEVQPSLEGMWVAALNLARGVANIVVALNPLAEPIGQGLVDLTEKFARWSDELSTSTGFQDFMDYAARVGPKVVKLIEQMALFTGRLVVAMAPIGETILDAVTGVFEWINAWDVDTLSNVVTVVAVLATTIWGLTGFVRTVKFVTEAWTAVSLIASKVQDVLAAAVGRYRLATVGATTQTGLLNGALFRAGAAGATGAVGLGAMTAVALPLALAIGAVGLAWWSARQAEQKAEEATDELGVALNELADAWETAANSADGGSTVVADSFRKITAQNQDMQLAVVTLTGLGVGLNEIAGAAAGSADELDRILGVISSRVSELEAAVEAANAARAAGRGTGGTGLDVEAAEAEIARLEKMAEKFGEAAEGAHLTSEAMKLLDEQQAKLVVSSELLTPAQQALADAHEVLADKSATAQEKTDALTKAQDTMRQSGIDAIEAEEGWEASLDRLTESVNAAKDAHDKDATSLSVHTETGRNNRDMLEAMITSANRMYDADVALNGVTQGAIDKGRGHYEQIKSVARQLGLSKIETDKLVASFGKIPENVETAIGFKAGEFDKMFEQLEQAAYIQKALKEGKDIDKARAEYQAMISDRNRAKNHGWAEGGSIDGPGIVGGKREDANLIWASRGEFMQPAGAVDYYGTGFMEAVRRREIPREMFPGYADGGSVLGGRQKWPFDISLAETWLPSVEDLQSAVFGAGIFDGDLGATKGGRGYRWQMEVLRNVFPGLAMISGPRPGSRTLSGNLSWHASGRAVDVPPKRSVAEWIAANYGRSTLELITPWRDLMLYKGRPHKYSRDVEAQHGVFGDNAHIHWAYDQGGMLPPGYSTVFNGTGRPEPVLSGQQWDSIDAMARAATSGGGGSTYNFAFRDTTLTPGKLRSLQDREAVLSRQDRPR